MIRQAPTIVDAHVHLWDPERFRYPWLDDVSVLRRPMLLCDLINGSATKNLSKFIFVECGCASSQSLQEVDWVSSMAQNELRLKGIVAHAPLELGKAARVNLESLARRPLVKGVRRNLQSEKEEFLQQTDFIEGLRLLPEFGFTFDLCIRAEQLAAANELVRCIPEVTFVLDHFGKPAVRNKGFEPWASHLRALAESDNVFCKVSGLVTEANWKDWQPADLTPFFEHALACFGPDRVIFGSDWPVATLATSYDGWIETVLKLIPNAKESDLVQLFQTNAERIYRV